MPTSKTAKKKNPHRGSSLGDFLKEEGIQQEVELAALKRVVALQLADIMEKNGQNKSALAGAMGTSRAALDRLLNPECKSVTLSTLTRAASAVGRKVRIDFVAA
ncbi:MAG: helix-turn-helix transcriptional regulator [Verrucomicrobiota bacterium]|jgi:DNA-binding Xre family transcriptional regulator|nr:helix-turn-helix transcriptional regulator [Verrucomicrobiota bacterium]